MTTPRPPASPPPPTAEGADAGASPTAVRRALEGVVDPCCREREISVVDMGLVKEIAVDGDRATVDLMLTSGWCPFQTDLVATVTDAIEALPEVATAEVRIVTDPWSTDRLSPDARRKLTFLPPPSAVGDRDAYVAARTLPLVPTAGRTTR